MSSLGEQQGRIKIAVVAEVSWQNYALSKLCYVDFNFAEKGFCNVYYVSWLNLKTIPGSGSWKLDKKFSLEKFRYSIFCFKNFISQNDGIFTA